MEPTKGNNLTIYVIGDSHSLFYNNIDICKVWHAGAILAYNLIDKREVYNYIYENVPKYSKLLFCFGEIDCRLHLYKHLNIEECANRYIKAVKQFKNDYSLIVAGPIASTPRENPQNEFQSSEYPTYGTQVQRNLVTRDFNEALRRKCAQNKIKFFTLFYSLITPNYLTRLEFYNNDKVHLNKKLVLQAIETLNDIIDS